MYVWMFVCLNNIHKEWVIHKHLDWKIEKYIYYWHIELKNGKQDRSSSQKSLLQGEDFKWSQRIV